LTLRNLRLTVETLMFNDAANSDTVCLPCWYIRQMSDPAGMGLLRKR